MDKKRSNSRLFIPATLIRLFFLVALFAGIPYIIIVFFQMYEEKASGIVDQQNAVLADSDVAGLSSPKEAKVLTQEQATTLNKIRDILQGDWISQQDGRYKLNIDSTNKFTEYYDGTKEGYGIWKVMPQSFDDSMPQGSSSSSGSSSSFSASSSDTSTYVFEKEQYEPGHKGEVYKYKIQQLDDQTFNLLFMGGNSQPLVFIKSV